MYWLAAGATTPKGDDGKMEEEEEEEEEEAKASSPLTFLWRTSCRRAQETSAAKNKP